MLAAGLCLALCTAGSALGVTLWGTSHGAAGFWTGGSIWTYDTISGGLSIKQTYSSSQLIAFGDIAVSPWGDVYVTYAAGFDNGYDRLAKVNTTTWAFDWVQDLGGWNDQVNALEFIGSDLYGVTGGGIDAYVLKFGLSDGGASVTNLGKIGKNSDGDLSLDPMTGQVYYTSWESTTSQLNTLDLSIPSETFVNFISPSNGWAGLAFSPDGTLWAGNYWQNNLYTLDPATGIATLFSGLPGVGSVTGLSYSPVPEPATLTLLGLGIASLGGVVARRRRQMKA